MTEITTDVKIDETCLNGFRPGYAIVFARYLARENDWTEELALRVLRDAVRFLSMCAIPSASHLETSDDDPRVMVCSPIVDVAVDAIFLDTPLLMWLEKNVLNVNRIVHVPAHSHGVVDPVINDARYEFTIALMLAAGYELDREVLWPSRLPAGYLTCTNRNDLEDCNVMVIRS